MLRNLVVGAVIVLSAPAAWAQGSSLPPHLQGRSAQEEPIPPHRQAVPGPEPKVVQNPTMFAFIAERPTLTMSPYLVDPGLFLLETGMEWLRESESDFDVNAWTTRVEGRYGFSSTWEFFGSVELLKDVDQDIAGDSDEGTGIGDMRAGAKWGMLKQTGSIPSAAAMVLWKIPTGNASRGLGTGEGDLEIRGMYGYVIENVVVNWDIGFAFISDVEETRSFKLQYITMIEVQVELTPFQVLGEFTYLSDANERGVQSTMMLGGAYFLNKDVRLDASLRFGLSQDADDIQFSFGVTFVGAKV